jgi:DNA-binding NtrC family response regulator
MRLEGPLSPGESAALVLETIQLEVTSGAHAGTIMRSAAPLLRLGASPENDLVLTDPGVSGAHAELTLEGDEVLVRDLGSTNGTRLEGLEVTEAQVALPARLTLGAVEVTVTRDQERRPLRPSRADRLGGLVGRSPAMREVFAMLRALAPTDATVLLQGEAGTGKEAAARVLHDLSGRAGPCVVFDGAAASPELIRSELFGHVKGAFTGASEDRPGKARAAHGGTLVLDEVGELSPDLQRRLLGLLERREVTPMGADRPVPVDARIVAATNRDLEAMVAAGAFREDLFHRLATITVELPPLRRRLEDLSLLVADLQERLGVGASWSEAAWEAARAHPWPGNVRALRNAVERSGWLAGEGSVEPEHLRLPEVPEEVRRELMRVDALPRSEGPIWENPDGTFRTLREVELDLIQAAMTRYEGDKKQVADALGMTLRTLYRRLEELPDAE